MVAGGIFSIFISFLLLVLFVLYAYKVALQYELLHLKKYRKKPLQPWACWRSGVKKEMRNETLMLYPLFFPVDFHDQEKPEIKEQKSGIKRINILIYWLLIVVLLLAVYVGKAQ
jgi:hypothetical protein